MFACALASWGSGGAEAPSAEPARKNLVENGDFEKGKGPGPAGWQRPDELTTSWVPAPGRKGKCIRIDTDVLASQFREREDAMRKAEEEGKEPPPPPRKKPTAPPKYDTVAGLDGVHFSSVEIPVKRDGFYRLEVDVRVDGTASPKVWVKASAKVTSRAGERERVVWKKSLNCDGAGAEWRTFSTEFPSTTRFPAGVDKVRVQLYPYWPPATYWFDDVRLTEIPRTDVRPPAAEGEEPGAGGDSGEAPRPREERKEETREKERGDGAAAGTIGPGAAVALAVAAAALGAEATAPVVPPWLEGYRLRRRILFDRKPSPGDAAILRVGTSRVTRLDARDLRIVLDHRQPIPLEVLEIGPGDTALVRFEVVDPDREHHLYLGNPSAPRYRRPRRPPRGGLLLEVREIGDGACDTWTDARRLLDASPEVRGYLLPRAISMGLPPLGLTGGHIARYTGWIRTALPGTWTFETASDGGSFVLVDRKLVASWPGFHGIGSYERPEERAKHSGMVKLGAGMHELEYVVATRSHGLHVLAWKAEADTKPAPKSTASPEPTAPPSVVSASALVPWASARLGDVETEAEPFADFDWKVASDTGSDVDRHDLAEVELRFSGDLRGRQARRTRWSFGDGQAAEGSEVRHVFLRHGLYEVRVEVEISSDLTVEATRTVAARFESLERTDLDRMLERYHEATRAYDLVSLPEDHLARLIWLRSMDESWKDDLRAAVDAWFRRDLRLGGPETERVERLGLERAGGLARESKDEDLARRILATIVASGGRAEARDEARAWTAILDSRSREPARAAAGEEALKTLWRDGGQGDAARRAGGALARILLGRGQEPAAREILEKLEAAPLARFRGNRTLSAGARSVSLDQLLREKRLREAREEVERWEWELPADRLTGALQLAWARQLLAEARPDEALRELESLWGLGSASREMPRALLVAADALEAKGDRESARERLQRIVREFPHRPESREAAARLEKPSPP